MRPVIKIREYLDSLTVPQALAIVAVLIIALFIILLITNLPDFIAAFNEGMNGI